MVLVVEDDDVVWDMIETTVESRTERYIQSRTQIVFLSFPLLLYLKLVAFCGLFTVIFWRARGLSPKTHTRRLSPPWPTEGAGTTFRTRPPSCL